jgi:hypothetical protein
LNTTKEKGDVNKFPLLSSLQQHHKRRRQHIAIIFFLSVTPPHKKMTTHYRRFLFKHKENKTHKKTTKKTKRREGAYLQAFTLPSHFWLLLLPFYFKRFLLGIFFFSSIYLSISNDFSLVSSSSQAEEKKGKTQRKNNHREEKNAKKGESLPFFFQSCIWDATFFLLFPLHIPSMLSSPPSSSSLVSHIALKLCVTQAWELSRWSEWGMR